MNTLIRISDYRIMRILVFFDLPTGTKQERKDASHFRKKLLDDGFIMFQFSIYVRSCFSQEDTTMHCKRVKSFCPERGSVCIMTITEKQFGKIEVIQGIKTGVFTPEPKELMLELF